MEPATAEIEIFDRERLLSAPATKRLFGNVSDMSLWRWLHDSSLGFPEPIVIRKRRFWRLGDLLDFIDRQRGNEAERCGVSRATDTRCPRRRLSSAHGSSRKS